ncbi:MAG: hypothetical protein AAGG50_02265 [Bacteroidota bacterium]
MSKPQRKFPIDFFDTLGEDPFLVADATSAPAGAGPLIPAARVTRERVQAFPDFDAPTEEIAPRSTYEPSPERRASTRSVFFADNRPAVTERAAPTPEAPPAEAPRPATQRVVLIARNGPSTEGMDMLEAALAEGWRVAHVAPTSADGPHFSALVFLERA